MSNELVEKKYTGSEMDEIEAPPLKMIISFLIITILGFLYALTWGFLLK